MTALTISKAASPAEPTRPSHTTADDAAAYTQDTTHPLRRRRSRPPQVWGPNGALILPWRPRNRRATPALLSRWQRALLALGLRTERPAWTEWQIRASELAARQRAALDAMGELWCCHPVYAPRRAVPPIPLWLQSRSNIVPLRRAA